MSIEKHRMSAKCYIDRWNPYGHKDERLEKFEKNFTEWLSQIPETTQEYVLYLLEGFCYYTHDKVNSLLLEFHLLLTNKYRLSPDHTIYSFIQSKKNISTSSNDYWTEYKFINNINKESCITSPDNLTDDEWGGIQNIVFVDDCSGTGKTFCDYLIKRKKRYYGKKIFFLTIHIMKYAKNKIVELARECKFDIEIIDFISQDKAFSSHYFKNEDELINAKGKIVEFSKKVEIPPQEILGFKESESLMAFYNNTPNNTLGFFRYDTENYFSIFPREKVVVPGWRKAARDKESRRQKNYFVFSKK